MRLKLLDEDFSIAKVKDLSHVDFKSKFLFLGKTCEEISVICPSSEIPKKCEETEHDYRGFMIEGTLDFGLIGILSGISSILAENGISVLAFSTYNTDYFFVKSDKIKKTVRELKNHGYLWDS